jgi:phage shock protein C
MSTSKQLYRSRTDRALFGVCGGLAEYFGIETRWVRLAFVLLALFGNGITFWLYLALVVFVPEASGDTGLGQSKRKNDDLINL